jgi:phospholipase C
MRWKTIAAGAMMLGGVAWMVTPSVSSASSVHGGNEHGGFPRYQHIVEIMMENTSFLDDHRQPACP